MQFEKLLQYLTLIRSLRADRPVTVPALREAVDLPRSTLYGILDRWTGEGVLEKREYKDEDIHVTYGMPRTDYALTERARGMLEDAFPDFGTDQGVEKTEEKPIEKPPTLPFEKMVELVRDELTDGASEFLSADVIETISRNIASALEEAMLSRNKQ